MDFRIAKQMCLFLGQATVEFPTRKFNPKDSDCVEAKGTYPVEQARIQL